MSTGWNALLITQTNKEGGFSGECPENIRSLDFYLVNEWEGRLIFAECLKTLGRRDLKLFRGQRKGVLEV